MNEHATGDQTSEPSFSARAADLAEQFPSLPTQAVAEALVEARRSVRLFGLSRNEEVMMTERIALSLLKQRTGDVEGIPRLDPESHPARRTLHLDRDGQAHQS
jgi:hypothetical protein